MITIVDYGMGNVGSLLNAIRRAGGHGQVSGDPSVVERADALILPGVGAFDTAARTLRQTGLHQALDICVRERQRPILGICLGMQLLGLSSEEGEEAGLGWIDARSLRFPSSYAGETLKIPHMGWNEVSADEPSTLFRDVPRPMRYYFVHSYHLECQDPKLCAGTSRHESLPFVCAVQKGTILGVQFHPEKSHKFGRQLFRNFIEIVETATR